MDLDYTVCPECHQEGLTKLVSCGGGIIIAGREANQYSDIQQARYWRDKNGQRHLVTSADGHSGSATINKKIATDAEVKKIRKRRKKATKKQRVKLQEEYTKTKLKVYRENL